MPNDVVPLSALQAGQWLEYRLAPESTAEITVWNLHLRGEVDPERVRRVWAAIVDRHAMLRATFVNDGASPYQRINERIEAPFEVIDATGADDATLAARMQAAQRTPIALERDVGVNLTLFRRAADDWTLLLRGHHVVADIFSGEILIDELARGLTALHRGEPLALGVPERTYAEFVAAEREVLASPRADEMRASWKRRLAGASFALDLPSDRPAPPRYRKVGRTLNVVLLDRDKVSALRALRESGGTTTFRLLLAAYAVLLHAYTASDDVIIGSPADCRGERFADVVGMFTNLLPLRSQLDRRATFDDLVRDLTARVASAVADRALPFSEVIGAIGAPHDPSRSGIYQASFIYNRLRRVPGIMPAMFGAAPFEWSAELGPLRVVPNVPIGQQEGAKELMLLTGEAGGRLVAEVKYNSDLFDEATAARAVDHLRNILFAVMADPRARVGSIPLMSAEERRRVVAWSAAPSSSSSSSLRGEAASVVEQVEAIARAAPNAPAIAWSGETLSYARLVERAHVVAGALLEAGVTTGALVGVHLERSIDFVASMLGVLRAGAAFVPLDPSYPAERLAFMLDDSAPAALVTSAALAERLGPGAAARTKLVVLDRLAPSPTARALPARAHAPSRPAYVIYTSGSTGRPKGVLVHAAGLANTAAALGDAWELGPESRLLGFASFSFDASVADVFPALTRGALLHLGAPDALAGGRALYELLRDERVTHVTLPPSVWLSLPDGDLPDLRVAVSAGEPCAKSVVERWTTNGRRFFNNYGPTEVTVCATVGEPSPADARPPIGRPLAGASAHLLDEDLEPVAVGVTGELYLGGAGVALGYWRRPEATAERFVPDPFSSEGRAGARLYKTGDMARRRPDGQLEFLGRRDAQVKLRGFRIELGEIETALRGHAAVADAALVVRTSGERQHLVAYVVPRRADAPPDAASIAAHAAGALPEYMVPHEVVVLSALPLTPSGKVDRAALPAIGEQRAEPAARGRAPRTPEERTMAGIWAEVLELPEVGIDDDFFALGGDSITALFVVDRVADEFACTIQPTAVRRAPTIAKLMNLLGIGRTDPRFTVLREPAGAAAGRTLYCLHATAGEVEAYRTLTDDVDETWGVIIVESDPATELATLAALGEQYARDIAGREKGDVALLGWSMGGVLAMEVARALEAMGRRVSFVALWDAYVKIAVPMEGVVGMLNAVGPAAAPLRRLDRSVQERAAAEVLRAPDSDRIAVALAIAERNGLVTEAARKTLAQRAALHRAHVRMMETHTPSGRLVAPVRVWCAKESARIADPAAWNAYAADVRVEVVDGGHFTMFLPPHGAALAKRLETALASAIDAR